MILTSANFEDRQSFATRLTVIRVATVVVFAAIGASFWVIQVVQHGRYEELAERQHLRAMRLRAPRGVLYDRNGEVLVRNTYSYTISIVREQSVDLAEAARRLAEATEVPEASINEIIANAKRRRDPLYVPVPIIEHATMAQVAAVSARQVDLPEVVVQILPTREYPGGGMAAHLFGYVGEIQQSQLARPEFSDLDVGAMVGQAGLERTYNSLLQGKDGKRIVAVNSRGREIEKMGEAEPIDGDRLQLTIDVDLQRAADAAFAASGYAGAAVFLDPRNGEVLSLTSVPSYDPNAFATGMDRAALVKLQTDPQKPFQNRLIQGTYPPGSTFKIAMSVAALETGVITPDFKVDCPGHFDFGGRSFKCSLPNGRGHGVVDLRHAIEKSCNVYFYTVASKMKIDTIHEYAEKLGIVGKTGIDLPGESDSFVASTEWSQRVRKQPWYPGETISVSIGQGAVNVTPIGLATMVSTMANGGTLITPHVLKAVDQGKGWESVSMPPPRSSLFIKPENLQAIRDGLWMVVNELGTGRGARIEGRDVSGKTGTAQVISNEGRAAAKGRTDKNLEDNAWFVFFAPRDNPQIAGAVFVEHGGHGGTTATPIAKHVLETFFAKQDGKPLPQLPPKPPAPKVGNDR
ncbi:MAG: penicillin-binding protein 2 [Acidobacteria bacterium]|nr:MAG: penicillin-binding protein 2 [Acidobacteriota bacterium]